jgi:pimeloyl-ACP methyl ester carboxylesterase
MGAPRLVLLPEALLLLFVFVGCLVAEERPLPQIKVFHRSGQTFVTWKEVGEADATYNLYRDDKPLTASTLEQAEPVAKGIPQGSAADFITQSVAWRRKKELPPAVNFPVEAEGEPLPKGTGLFVYTPGLERTSYYALTVVWPEGGEDRRLEAGVNTAPSVLEGTQAPASILTGKRPEGDSALLEYLQWATPVEASVDGHPYRFVVAGKSAEVKAANRGLIVRLHHFGSDYLGQTATRPGFVTLALDDYTPGIAAESHQGFWFGYRENYGTCYLVGKAAERAGGACLPAAERGSPVPVRDYTQRRMLRTIEEVVGSFGLDRNRIYLTGGSMGGMGTVDVGLRHPELFAALEAHVPVINPARSKFYAQEVLGEVWTDRNWPLLPDGEGHTLGERLDDTAYVANAKEDLPLLKFFNARQDTVIGWTQIPEFMHALTKARQPFIAAWDNRIHTGEHPERPKTYDEFDVFQIRRNECVPALSNASTAEDPGHAPAEGDPAGGINDDFRWSVAKDAPDTLVLRLWRVPKVGKFAGVDVATVDVTPRRRQAFRPGPGAEVTFRNESVRDGAVLEERTLTVDSSGLFTAEEVSVDLEPGNRLVFGHSPAGK